MADARNTAKAQAAVYLPLLRKLGVDDATARDEGTVFALALLGSEYRQRLAVWEAGPTLKEAVAMLRRLETLSGELARCLETCPPEVMNLLRRPFPLSKADARMRPEEVLAMFRDAGVEALPSAFGERGEWATRLSALSRFCGRAVARMQEEVGASSGDAIARGGRQRVAALCQPHPAWDFTEKMLALAERLLGRALGGKRGDGARFGAFLDAAAMAALDREVTLADAYGRRFVEATVQIRTINRQLDGLGAAAMAEEKGRLLSERGRLKRRLQEGPRKARRPAAREEHGEPEEQVALAG